jgi:hypothetical protein
MTAQINATHIPEMNFLFEIIGTTDQNARDGNINQDALHPLTTMHQNTFVTALKPPPLPLDIILRSHTQTPFRRQIKRNVGNYLIFDNMLARVSRVV